MRTDNDAASAPPLTNHRAEEGRGLPPAPHDVGDVRLRLAAWTRETAGAVLVAEADDQVVGAAAVAAIPYLERRGRCGRIVALVAAAGRRGQGKRSAARRSGRGHSRCPRLRHHEGDQRTKPHESLLPESRLPGAERPQCALPQGPTPRRMTGHPRLAQLRRHDEPRPPATGGPAPSAHFHVPWSWRARSSWQEARQLTHRMTHTADLGTATSRCAEGRQLVPSAASAIEGQTIKRKATQFFDRRYLTAVIVDDHAPTTSRRIDEFHGDSVTPLGSRNRQLRPGEHGTTHLPLILLEIPDLEERRGGRRHRHPNMPPLARQKAVPRFEGPHTPEFLHQIEELIRVHAISKNQQNLVHSPHFLLRPTRPAHEDPGNRRTTTTPS